MKKRLTNTKNPKIVILGGGLAGLTAGYELAQAGKDVTVVEQHSGVGGLARTITVGKFKFDTGPHRWYTKNDMVNRWMLSLLKDETIKVPRLTRIYFDGKFFNYPIKIGNAMKGIGLKRSVKSLIDYVSARIVYKFTNKKPATLEEGYIAQFGKTLYRTFFERYSEKLWGRKCSQISADWISQRSRGLDISTILKNALFGSEKVVSFVDEFSYPKKGIGRLADKLAEGIIKKGGKVRLNSKVVTVNHRGTKISTVVVNNKDQQKIITGDEFISSIAISDLVSALNPQVPAKVTDTNRKLEYRDEVQVVLFINKEKITDDTWIYVHPFELAYMRVMEMDNWSKQLSPKGTTALVFEIACNEGDNIWKTADKELIRRITGSYLKEFNLINNEDISGGFVHRITKTYPVYHLGYQQDVSCLKGYLHKFTNLQLIGRNGIFRYNNMDHSVEMGLYAAFNIINNEKKFDIEAVNIEREFLEEKKIEAYEDELVEKNSQ